VLGGLAIDELAEGPCPHRIGIAVNGLGEQPRPNGPVVEALAVFGADFDQRRAADDSQ
jgi:hypothetical protein